MKIKKLLSVILAIVLTFGVFSAAYAADEIPEGYTPIYTAEDLNNIRNNLAGKYILMNDIDLSAYENWMPIGTSSSPFTGELDGNGKLVLNLTIKDCQANEDKIYCALFSSMNASSVTDLNLINVDIDIQNTDDYSVTVRAAALAGYASYSVVENCIVTGNINIKNFNTGYIGGLFGSEIMVTPSNCVNYADITVSSDYISDISVGGIAGSALMIAKCCNYGNIAVLSTDSDDSDSSAYIGGICGQPHQFGNAIHDCYNRGSITLGYSTPSTYVGGIIGQCLNLENCYNSGDINYTNNFKGSVGAIAGELLEWISIDRGPHIDNAYYNNTDLLYVSEPDEYDDINNVSLLNEEEFKNQDNFVGFDFENVWEMEENGYPVFKNQPEVTVKESIELKIGETYLATPGNAYHTTNEAVARTDINGKIVAEGAGTAVVTVDYEYGYRVEYNVSVIGNVEEPVNLDYPCFIEFILTLWNCLKESVLKVIAWLKTL